MPTTDRDLQAIHYLATRLREDTTGAGEWHDAGLSTELAKFKGHSLAITLERLRHASDPEARTPAALSRPWTAAPPTPGARHPVKAGEDCRVHLGEDRDNCRQCAVADIPHPEDPEPSEDMTAGRTLGRGPFRTKTTTNGAHDA